MIRSLAAFFCAVVAVFAAPLLAADAAALAGESRALPMRFELRQEAPADACGTACRRWISAAGAITADTPRDFLAFVNGKNLRGSAIAFDSDGGSVLGALALGREIRRLDLATSVGRAVERTADGVTTVTLDPRADCESMCAFVLLAGVRRHVPAEARVMVHQIWLGDRRDDPTAASYSAEDLVLVQRDIGRIVQYTVEMGASAELIDIALRIPPWEPMRELTRDELRRLKFLTADTPFDKASPPSPDAVKATTAAPLGAPAAERARAARRAWTLDDGGAAMTRRHPLTVEGDDIGAFNLTLACGRDSESYSVSYQEWRHGVDGAVAAASPRHVTLMIGPQALPLAVDPSASGRIDGHGIRTQASGTVSSALIKSLARVTSRSLTVATSSASADTSIRLGNTGLAQNFPSFAARCDKLLTAEAERPRPKTGALAHAD